MRWRNNYLVRYNRRRRSMDNDAIYSGNDKRLNRHGYGRSGRSCNSYLYPVYRVPSYTINDSTGITDSDHGQPYIVCG